MTLGEIVNNIRIILGETEEQYSKLTDAQIIEVVNAYSDSLPVRVDQVIREHGRTFAQGVPKHPMWLTKVTLNVVSGNNEIALPSNFWSLARLRSSDKVVPVYRSPFTSLLPFASGPTQYAELLPASLTLHPTPDYTGTFELLYYRVPTRMTDPGHSPDAESRFHWLFVVGPVTELIAPDDPIYDRYQRREKEYLRNLVQESGGLVQ